MKMGDFVRVVDVSGLEDYDIKEGFTTFVNSYMDFPEIPNQGPLVQIYCNGAFYIINADRLEVIDKDEVVDVPEELMKKLNETPN